MSTPQPLALPPGFEQLSNDRQIDYIEQLWALIISVPDEVPIPGWHLEIVRSIARSHPTNQLSTWSEVKQKLTET